MNWFFNFLAWLTAAFIIVPIILIATAGTATIVLVLVTVMMLFCIIAWALGLESEPTLDRTTEALDRIEKQWAEKHGMAEGMMMRAELEGFIRDKDMGKLTSEEVVLFLIEAQKRIKAKTAPRAKPVPKVDPDLKTLRLKVLPETKTELRNAYVARAKEIRTDLAENHLVAVDLNAAYTRLRRNYA